MCAVTIAKFCSGYNWSEERSLFVSSKICSLFYYEVTFKGCSLKKKCIFSMVRLLLSLLSAYIVAILFPFLVLVKSLSRVWLLPGFSIHGVFQARILEWVAISFSRGSSPPRDQTQVSCIEGRCFTLSATREVLRLVNMFKSWFNFLSLGGFTYVTSSICGQHLSLSPPSSSLIIPMICF